MRNVQNAHQWHCSLPFSASELNNKSRNILLREKERVMVYDREKENISVHVTIVYICITTINSYFIRL